MAHIPENQTPERDLYGESVLLQELKTQLSAFEDHSEAVVTMKVVDLDSTFTGDTEKGNAVRAKWAAEHQGTIAITSRTAEMTMSSTSYQSSADKGEMLRRPPLFGKVDGKFVYINPENVVAPLIDYGQTDSQTGGMRDVRQADDSYMHDTDKEERLRRGRNWRQDAQRVLTTIFGEFTENANGELVDPDNTYVLAGIEKEGAYEVGDVDVEPTDFRIQVNTIVPNVERVQEGTGASSAGKTVAQEQMEIAISRKEEFVRRFHEYKNNLGSDAYHAQVADLQQRHRAMYDSLAAQREQIGDEEFYAQCRAMYAQYESALNQLQIEDGIAEEMAILKNIALIDDSNPEKGKCGVYMVPARSGKDRAMKETLDEMTTRLGIDRNQIKVDYFGDSFPDLELLKTLGEGSSVVLVGGSRLTRPLQEAYAQASTLMANRREIHKSYNILLSQLDANDPQRDALIEQMQEELDANRVHFANEGLLSIGNRMIPAYDQEGNVVDGMMYFIQPMTGNAVRVVLGDVVYPTDDGGKPLKEVATIHAYENNPIETTYRPEDAARFRKKAA